jgi:type IV secretion system protein VirB9
MIRLVLSLLIWPLASSASVVPAIEPEVVVLPYKGKVTSQQRKEMNAKEKKATELARQWIEAQSLPVRKENGKIVYLYGSTLPSVICAPLAICDIELEEGEKLVGVPLVGDSVRWETKIARSGEGAQSISHIVVKPYEPNLSTTLIATTNKRTYHIKLVSSPKNWTPRIAFTYPEDIDRQWQAYNQQVIGAAEKATLPDSRERIDSLNFDYDIDGKTPWKPIRVYNDGKKTYIQMPSSMAQTEAPALLVLGALDEQQIVNYRLKQDRYIVDQIFSKAILIAGVGASQEKITITYNQEMGHGQ